MALGEYDRLDALGLAELVRKREVTPLELLEEAIARAETANPSINAIICKLYDEARAAARAGLPQGPFTGVPYLVKDVGPFLAGAPMHMGSRACRGFVPGRDAELFRRSKAAGLNIFGKTNAPEFGIMPVTEPELFGPTRNPWDLARTPGGSSGGAAAAVAAGIVPMAHGNDGGGSIRIPSSCCGLFGLKPSRGRQPTGPDGLEFVGALSIDHVLSRTVRDSAAQLDVSHGGDPGMLFSAPSPAAPFASMVDCPPRRLRIAMVTDPMQGKMVDPECRAAQLHTARLLGELGHVVEEAAPSGIDYHEVTDVFCTLFFGAIASAFRYVEQLTGRPVRQRDVETATWFVVANYRAKSAMDVSHAVEAAGRYARTMAEFMSTYDLVLTPTLAAPPIPIGAQQPTSLEKRFLDFVGAVRLPLLLRLALAQFASRAFDWVAFTPLFNMTGQPAMSVPLYWSRDGLPIGSQLIARYGEEATLFQVAGELERAQPWFDRRPPALTSSLAHS